MRLLYATSISYPSGLANRMQILAMSKAFGEKMGNDFWLGGENIVLSNSNFQILNFQTGKSYFLAWKYLKFAKKNNVNIIYCREPKLLLFLTVFGKISGAKLKYAYEIHRIIENDFLNGMAEKIISFFADYYVFVTRHLADMYLEKYGLDKKQTFVAPDGVDMAVFDIKTIGADLRGSKAQINADDKSADEFLYPDISYKIRGACFKVWKEFRGSVKESAIEKALKIELEKQGLNIETQKRIPINYEGEKVGDYVPDMVVEEKVLIELKSKIFITKEDERQFWLYLKGSKYKLGFLINFGKSLEIKRKVYDTARSDQRASADQRGSEKSQIDADNQRKSASDSYLRESAVIENNLRVSARKLLNLPQDKKIIGYCGRYKTMGEDKGFFDILEALKFLPENVIFVAMGGKPRHVTEYQKVADDMGLHGKAFFRDHQTQEIVAIYQKAFDVLLMPFPDIPHYRYFMSPMKMFEYMASKRPIVASDLPSVREVLNESNAMLVEAGSPKSLADGIQKVLDNPDFAQKIATKAYEDAKMYTWDMRVENIIQFLG